MTATAVSTRWQDFLATREVEIPPPAAADLFMRCFKHPAPDYPRHFVLEYFPSGVGRGAADAQVVAYTHQMAFGEVYLGGGMCVDERAYRRFPKWLFQAVRDEGGLATLVSKGSIAQLGDSPACFGHVGEPRARQADIRTGFVDTGHPHLMVFWRGEVDASEKRRLIDKVAAFGPF